MIYLMLVISVLIVGAVGLLTVFNVCVFMENKKND
jgi:hypothetical protein